MTFCACEHDIVRVTDFNVTLDTENTYKAGEPVRFNFEGEVDNIIFYSGETGSKYEYKDRYFVPIEDVLTASLDMDVQARYGVAGALEIWVSNTFEGLDGEDAAADKGTIKAMVEGGMNGWTKLEYEEGASTKWTEHSFDLSKYRENFCIAFHWCPPQYKQTQRTYWINGQLSLDLANAAPTTVDLSELGFTTVMMNEEIEDPYHKNAGDGSIILNNPGTGALIFQGIGANKLEYCLDGWAISKPAPLNRVANDKATVIKNMQNYLNSYEYTWTKPGTYDVTFIGSNSSYRHETQQKKEFTIIIAE